MITLKEIGGFFGLDQFINNEYYDDLIALNTGRNALVYLLKAKSIKKLYIPYYLCSSISETLKKYEYDFDYYNLNFDFLPIFNDELLEGEYLYIVNYYGQLKSDRLLSLKNKYKRIIIDNAQAFFQRPVEDLDTIYSCRKYFGVPDGAYLSTDTVLCEELEYDVSKERMTHVLGRYEANASGYYSNFQDNSLVLGQLPLKQMSKLTKNILSAIDYSYVINRRNDNFAYLNSKLGANNKLDIIIPNGAFAYPYYIENGIELRKLLSEIKIYIPILWPGVLERCKEGSLEFDYAANILPLPCDQRYNIDDMQQIVNAISGRISNV